MKITLNREKLLRPLLLATSVVDKKQTLPVLSNIYLKLSTDSLEIVGTDSEIEIKVTTKLVSQDVGETTLPARKLFDICKSLPDGADLTLTVESERALLVSGKSRFSLHCLPAIDLPRVKKFEPKIEFNIDVQDLKEIIDRTQFSMGQQDVRFYLNGLMLEIQNGLLVSVATDGHRLSYCQIGTTTTQSNNHQIIIPRKGVHELSRLLADYSGVARVRIGDSHVGVSLGDVEFTSKLIAAKYPDYEQVIPQGAEIKMTADKEALRQALIRTSILSNEKYRGIRFYVSNNKLSIKANNPEREAAEEELDIEYSGDNLEIGFNVNYLLDVLTAIPEQSVQISMRDPSSSCILQNPNNKNCKYVIMPMRL